MLKVIFQQLKISLLALLTFTILTGFIYPTIVTILAQLFFPWQANGSLIEENHQLIGSQLIGQYFNDPAYFWGRPSATYPMPYNGGNSAGSNMGPINPVFLETIAQRVQRMQVDNFRKEPVPVDLVTASGSGLDPDISPLAAFYQVPRIAKTRQIPEHILNELIERQINTNTFGILGEPRINVLKLNIALDNLKGKDHARAS